MASRLNHLLQTAPRQFLERTVLFTDGLSSPEAAQHMRNKIAHCIDIEPTGQHLQARARVLAAQHHYQDAPMLSYFVPPDAFAIVPKEDPLCRFIFLPEFTRSRLLVSYDGENTLRFQLEENLSGRIPPPDAARYVDSLAYWDHTGSDLVGVVRATAILYKEAGQVWTITMQQIVGTAGHEVVRQATTRALAL